MAVRLYVGNLPFSFTEESLKSTFAPYGTVVFSRIITDKMSGRSRGFGFVEMSTDEETKAAVSGMNDTELEGRKLVVNEARPMEDRPPRRSFSR